MSSKKGLELLKTIGKYISETDGFDKVVKNVSKLKINIFRTLKLTRRQVTRFSVLSLHCW